MALTREQVLHVATLCRIGLTEEEVERFRVQLSQIVEQFAVLQQIDTTEVPPTSHSVALASVMRPDEPQAPFPREEILRNAPRREGAFFRVPLVLEES
ncbi:MAG: Asp-tRNA(Asn)/Glu-tRNA(Gln) amidotransferase subunit GatC [Dehalococcoidia bacterium]|nr:Asp-tRNA(Asn)/Glu-tRNA(Gln) amidotransferase subunit GatC [Dehalococcoidia bacterium]MDW8120610.1 Asp-tRNA(Asn)/Glu-tRNA(Gln) amidotransferase subunit GatC [Chloroflexota bacterium]